MVYNNVVIGLGALAIGYVLFGRKGEDGSGGGGGGVFEDEGEDLAETLGLDRMPLIINIPALPSADNGETLWAPWPDPPVIPDITPDPGTPDKGNIIDDIINNLSSITKTPIIQSFFEPKKGIIPTDASGMPVKSPAKIRSEKFLGNIGSGVKSFFAVKTPLADRGIGKRTTTTVKSKKGRSARVKAWKKRYGEPTYSGTGHRVKA